MDEKSYRRTSPTEAEQYATKVAYEFLLTIANDPHRPWKILACGTVKSPTTRKVRRHWWAHARNWPKGVVVDGGEVILNIDLEAKSVMFREHGA